MLPKKFKFEVENEGISYTATRLGDQYDTFTQYKVEWVYVGKPDRDIWAGDSLVARFNGTIEYQRKWFITEVIEE